MSVPLSRRAVLAGAGAALAVSASARAQPSGVAARFSALRVDTGPLAARGGGGSADLIQRLLPEKMQSVFGDLVMVGDRRAPALVARIETIYLSGYADTFSPGLDIQQRDSMDGAGIVVANRQVQASTPLHVTLPASYSGAYYLPDIDARRIDSLCYQFAYWLRREMQL